MPRSSLTLEDSDAAGARVRGTWTRDKAKAFIERRYNTRVHMSLILSACGLTAMLASAFMLHYGVTSMLVRYPLAMLLAYVMFFVGVWTWLRVTGLVDNSGGRKTRLDGTDALDLLPGGGSSGGSGGSIASGGVRGGGGTFDGGGASASFAEGRAPLMAAGLSEDSAVRAPAPRSSASSSVSSSRSKGSSLFDGLDGDGIVLLILAALLVVVVFVASGYLIWCAPDVLTEAAFGAMLTGTLARPTAQHSTTGWIAGVISKTWWPFAIVLLAAVAFAAYAGVHYPDAHTFRQAIAAALH